MARRRYIQSFVLCGLSCLVAAAVGCEPAAEDSACGLSRTPPSAEEVMEGFVNATANGAPYTKSGSWSSGSNGDITAGTLSMIIANDETGSVVSELVGKGAFPICVPLGERSPSSGSAAYESKFVTDASHTGMVAILGEDAGFLFGRFEVQLKDGSGNSADTVAFTNGTFRIPAR